MGGKTALHPQTTMQPSTLVLTALLQLNEDMRDNDAFLGYTDDAAGTVRLLEELWEQYSLLPSMDATADDLVEAWYLTTLGEDAAFAL